MHKTNVLTFGSKNFNTSLEELKDYLNFKLITTNNDFEDKILDDCDVLLIHEEYLKENTKINFLRKINKIKILAFHTKKTIFNNFKDKIQLPTTIKDINQIIENSIIKKSFNKNSSIKIKNYILNKNEKKLSKLKQFITLTEKEVQLLELFLNSKKPISKDNILSSVWNYSADADTHTVETHIYRLRKKVTDKFMDEKFILNNKDGYYL
jgi:hypothetical protein